MRKTGWSCSGGTCRIFAAKWLYITAQGSSPGYAQQEIRPACPPLFWEGGTKEEKWRPRRVFRLFACYQQCAQHQAPLSGHLLQQRDPGLKPWAVLFGRFAAKSDKPRRDGVICLVMTTYAWPPPNLVPAARLFEKVRVK